MNDDASLIAALVSGNAAAATAVMEDRAEREARQEAQAAEDRESKLAGERRAAQELRVRENRDRMAGAALFVLLAFAAPVMTAFAQFNLQNPGSAAAMPIWVAGLASGLTAWFIAGRIAGDVLGRMSSFLDKTYVYVIVGFLLWIVLGTVLSGLRAS